MDYMTPISRKYTSKAPLNSEPRSDLMIRGDPYLHSNSACTHLATVELRLSGRIPASTHLENGQTATIKTYLPQTRRSIHQHSNGKLPLYVVKRTRLGLKSFRSS